MDLNNNNNSVRVDENVNPNYAYKEVKRKRPLTEEEKRKYEEAQRRYSSRQEHKDPKEIRNTNVRGKIKDRSEIEDTMFKVLTNGLLQLENNYGLNEKCEDGRRVKDLPIKEFYQVMAKKVTSMPMVKRHEMCQKAAPAVGLIQTCLNYMEYYRIVKIRFEVLMGCSEICKVMEMLKFEKTKNDAVQNMNRVLTALHRNDLKGEKAVSVPSYRFVRMLCVFIMFRDYISASVFARMIFGQALLEQELKQEKELAKGVKQNNVRQGSELWRNVKN